MQFRMEYHFGMSIDPWSTSLGDVYHPCISPGAHLCHFLHTGSSSDDGDVVETCRPQGKPATDMAWRVAGFMSMDDYF